MVGSIVFLVIFLIIVFVPVLIKRNKEQSRHAAVAANHPVDNLKVESSKGVFMNIRTIGKVGFLLAAIGFFMPVACDQNAFQLIEYVDAPAPALIIGLFVFAAVGILIGALLLAKKNVPIALDWVVILGSIIAGIVLLSKNELDLQYGAYVIITGLSLALLLQIVSAIKKET